jgi:RNA polymerase sigma factor (sigma-70 family)
MTTDTHHQAAFLAAYSALQRSIELICFRHGLRHESEEIYSQVGFAGWKAVIAGNEIENWQAYLLTVANFRCSEHLRDKYVLCRLHGIKIDPLDKRNQDSVEILIDEEERLRVRQLLCNLSPKERRIIELRWEGKRNKDVAKILEIEPKRVARVFWRALAKLRRGLLISTKV